MAFKIISRDMAKRLIKKFGWDNNAGLPVDDIRKGVTEVMLMPFGSKVCRVTKSNGKRGCKYMLFGYAADKSDIRKPLLEVWEGSDL